ncbi:MAG: TRAM domain-containing protein, partial [Methanomassiliicoccales archaeon]|nr:TRAM domain-containing protein [Methanomassiliicoccales archaeon]
CLNTRETESSAMAFEHGFKGKKPVEEGKEYTVTITDIGSQGDGIARIEGFVVFVPETKVGQAVKVKITRVGNKSAFAKVVE